MKLWIIRHGIAHDIGEAGITRDEERTLSPKGIHRTRDVARALSRFDAAPTRMASSPYPRALDTARILAAELNPDIPIDVIESLQPGGAADEPWHWLRRHAGEPQLMVVGHMPEVAMLAARCISRSADCALRFGKAAACAIDFDVLPDPGTGLLEFLLQPAALRAAAR